MSHKQKWQWIISKIAQGCQQESCPKR